MTTGHQRPEITNSTLSLTRSHTRIPSIRRELIQQIPNRIISEIAPKQPGLLLLLLLQKAAAVVIVITIAIVMARRCRRRRLHRM